MGSVRLILSLLVVGSHVGGLGDSLAGGTAVASFFTISGFLMARTIAENYPGSGFPRLYLNRIIRLVPPFAGVMAATALLLWARDSRGFEVVRGSSALYMPVAFPASIATLVEMNPRAGPTFVVPQVHLLPQAWSLVVEAAFYLIAPVGVWLMNRRHYWVVWAVIVVSLGLWITAARLQLDWMRSPFATVWMFLLGGEAYAFLMTSSRIAAIPRGAAFFAPLPIAFLVLMGVGKSGVPLSLCLILAPWLIVLSYGVFVGHFLSPMLFLWVAEIVYNATGAFGVFGIPEISNGRLYLTA